MTLQVPSYSWSDEADLLWYHGKGQTLLERSQAGGMLENASMAINGSWPMEFVLNAAGVCIGQRSAVTARPTAEIRSPGGYTPDDGDMIKAARVSRRLILVGGWKTASIDGMTAVKAIGAYFGDLGARWAGSETGFGRIGALFHLTVKGRKLIEAEEKAPNAMHLTPEMRIESIAKADKIKAKEERTFALQVCAQQAWKLESEARAVWHAVSH